MKKLAIAFAVGAAALLGSSAANAADGTVKARAATEAATDVSQSTDFSAHRRHYRHYRHHRVVRYGYARPYYRSYAYAPRPYYSGYAPRYYGGGYGGGPVISLGFGGGGWGHHRGW